ATTMVCSGLAMLLVGSGVVAGTWLLVQSRGHAHPWPVTALFGLAVLLGSFGSPLGMLMANRRTIRKGPPVEFDRTTGVLTVRDLENPVEVQVGPDPIAAVKQLTVRYALN